ncbi:MAG TPA: hypothetical protein VGC79_37145, partial [Polyangiaceae bacterium]
MLRSFQTSILALLSFNSFGLLGCDVGSTSSGPSGGTTSAGSAAVGTAGATAGGSTASGGSASGGTASGGTASGGSASQAGSSAVAGASGSASGGTSGAAASGGNAPTLGCTGALICDDFEAYSGTPGAPWKITKTKFGNVTIDGTQHRSGTKAVKFTTSGGADPDFYQLAYISLESIFPIANNAFYGRMMFYVT